jgi:hypothetical protein
MSLIISDFFANVLAPLFEAAQQYRRGVDYTLTLVLFPESQQICIVCQQ